MVYSHLSHTIVPLIENKQASKNFRFDISEGKEHKYLFTSSSLFIFSLAILRSTPCRVPPLCLYNSSARFSVDRSLAGSVLCRPLVRFLSQFTLSQCSKYEFATFWRSTLFIRRSTKKGSCPKCSHPSWMGGPCDSLYNNSSVLPQASSKI